MRKLSFDEKWAWSIVSLFILGMIYTFITFII